LTARRGYYFAAENVEAVDRWLRGLLKLIGLFHKMIFLSVRELVDDFVCDFISAVTIQQSENKRVDICRVGQKK